MLTSEVNGGVAGRGRAGLGFEPDRWRRGRGVRGTGGREAQGGTWDACRPWLLPSLQFTGWSVAQGTQILHDALVRFRAMLLELAGDGANNFTLVDTQGTLQPSQWANELHPTPDGFKLIAAKFANSLRFQFPGRI